MSFCLYGKISCSYRCCWCAPTFSANCLVLCLVVSFSFAMDAVTTILPDGTRDLSDWRLLNVINALVNYRVGGPTIEEKNTLAFGMSDIYSCDVSCARGTLRRKAAECFLCPSSERFRRCAILLFYTYRSRLGRTVILGNDMHPYLVFGPLRSPYVAVATLVLPLSCEAVPCFLTFLCDVTALVGISSPHFIIPLTLKF